MDANLVGPLLVVNEVGLHVQQALVVVHVLGEVRVLWVLLQEGVGGGHGLLQVVRLKTNNNGEK